MEPIERYLGQGGVFPRFDLDSEPQTGSPPGQDGGGNLDEAAEKFRQALSQGGPEGEENADKDAKDDSLPSPFQAFKGPGEPGDAERSEMAAGDFILRAFGAMPPQPVAGEAAEANPEGLKRLDTEILERLLVTDGSVSQKQEVRMTFKDSVLPDTEVRLSREGGEVRVRFVTGSEEAAALLGAHLDDLRRLLEEKFPGERVVVESEREREEGADGEENEGRSRNRYEGEEGD